MGNVAQVDTRLNSLFEPGFASEDRVLMDARGETPTPGVLSEAPVVKIRDGRELQSQARTDESFTEAGFFDDHSFVLLDHVSAVRNWDIDPADPGEDTQISRIYFAEIASIIRERLLPRANVEIPHVPYLLRRGSDTPNPFYGQAAHQDYGLGADDYEENVAAYGTDEAAAAWRRQYDRDEVTGFLVINFWRTVYMDEPLRHLPLAICDPYTVEPDDVVSTGLMNFTPTGRPSNQLGVCHNPAHHWYYYPGMTTEEVLAFKNFQCWKSDLQPKLRTCFHSAFDEPQPPGPLGPLGRVSERQSCEYRVGVFFLRD